MWTTQFSILLVVLVKMKIFLPYNNETLKNAITCERTRIDGEAKDSDQWSIRCNNTSRL